MEELLKDKVILVVDDEEMLREGWAKYLRSRGCQVLTAENGKVALHTLQKRIESSGVHGVDVIVSDWMMPELNGPGLLKAVRENAWTDIAVVMVSGNVTKVELEGIISWGGDTVLLKPFALNQLEERILLAIERREQAELARIQAEFSKMK